MLTADKNWTLMKNIRNCLIFRGVMKTHLLAIVPIVYYSFSDSIKCLQLGTVLLTSINYWRNPCKGFRRNIDITAVFSINIYNAYMFPCIWIPVGIICFSLWRISNHTQKLWIHSLIHIIGSGAFFITPSLKSF